MGRKKPTARDEENLTSAPLGKSKKKALVIDDDEYAIGTELSEESQVEEDKLPNANKKKGKKGASKSQSQSKNDDHGDDGNVMEVEDEADVGATVSFTGKKKSMSKKGGASNNVFSASNFAMLDDNGEGDEDDVGTSSVTADRDSDEDEAQVISFTGKKKPTKKNGKGGSAFSVPATSSFDALNDDEAGNDGEIVDNEDKVDGDGDNDEISQIAFVGKKKPSKNKKKGGGAFTALGFDALNEEEEAEQENKVEDNEEDVAAITFSGKKKKSSKSSKKGGNSSSAALVDEAEVDDPSGLEVAKGSDDDAEDEDATAISFTGKKKSSKKKSNFVTLIDDTNLGSEVMDTVQSEPTGGLANGLEGDSFCFFF